MPSVELNLFKFYFGMIHSYSQNENFVLCQNVFIGIGKFPNWEVVSMNKHVIYYSPNHNIYKLIANDENLLLLMASYE